MSFNENIPETSIPVKDQLRLVPEDPGVYRYFDKKGKLLYIGKAKNLKRRVTSYFSNKRGHSFRIATMVKQVALIRYTITNSEVEALTLENNLIKEHQPKYNILLKDGKTYPYICVKNERFPRVFPTRNRIKDGSQYFGPFTSVTTMNSILDLIRKNFKLRTCNYHLSETNVAAKKYKLCLEYQIGNCAGPCEGLISEEVYNENIDIIRKILKGDFEQLLGQLEANMIQASEEYQFEKAEEIRQRLEKIRVYKRKNTIISEKISNVDVLTIDRLNNLSITNHFKVVSGAVVGTHTFEYRIRNEEEDTEILQEVFEKLHLEGVLAKEILTNIPLSIEGQEEKYTFRVPQRGDKKKLIDLSLKNSRRLLEEKVWKQNFKKKTPQEAIMEQMQADLRLKELPLHIECFDNSNFQGTDPVASLVVFKNGKPSKKDYRHFKIKTVVGPDDFASMEEIVFRRYKRLLDENSPLPNLLIVDGGKGQLNAAAKSLRKLDLIKKLPIIGIAKRLEEIYRLNDPIPLHLDKRSTSLKVIQHLRNESHRFAITFHRDLRSKRQNSTKLTQVEGIGESTSKKLLSHFRSVKKIREASELDLVMVIGASRAKKLLAAIKKGEV